MGEGKAVNEQPAAQRSRTLPLHYGPSAWGSKTRMAKIVSVEVLQVDLAPKVKRSVAIQNFEYQETLMVRITDSDGVTGTGYSYTIGTGGSSVIRLLDDHLVPRLLHREADDIERIWRSFLLRSLDDRGCAHVDRAGRHRLRALVLAWV
jgi:L-alanine-DL-glutamate epimerase-like enolase superfamily enzyme